MFRVNSTTERGEAVPFSMMSIPFFPIPLFSRVGREVGRSCFLTEDRSSSVYPKQTSNSSFQVFSGKSVRGKLGEREDSCRHVWPSSFWPWRSERKLDRYSSDEDIISVSRSFFFSEWNHPHPGRREVRVGTDSVSGSRWSEERSTRFGNFEVAVTTLGGWTTVTGDTLHGKCI